MDLILCVAWIGVALAIHHRYAALSGSGSPVPLREVTGRSTATAVPQALAA
ncbi:MAG TPA: hypothetical protein VFD38_20210 [Myxococcaceae bacterium]|nr:hypothetical protein [Myxococcaceae bacterium]